MKQLLEMIDFIENHSTEERIYLELSKEGDTRPTVEVIWQKTSEKKAWRMRPANLIQWQHFTHSQLISQLVIEGVSIVEFAEGLRRTIISQAIHADYYYREAQKLVGHKTVLNSKNKAENFLSALSKVINERPSKRVISQRTTFKSKRSVGHLSLISPEQDRRNRQL